MECENFENNGGNSPNVNESNGENSPNANENNCDNSNLNSEDELDTTLETCEQYLNKKEFTAEELDSMSERAAVALLQSKNILPRHVKCPKKSHQMTLKYQQDGTKWRCRKQKCDSSYSVRRGTWLEGMSLPLNTLISFIYYWTKEQATIDFCREEFWMNQAAVVNLNSYLREVCGEALLKEPIRIGGPNCTVEIDESFYRRRTFSSRPNILPDQLVFSGICHETQEVFLHGISDKNKETLESCIQMCIIPGTTIFSDNWNSYEGIKQLEGYKFKDLNIDYLYMGNPVGGYPIVGSYNSQNISNLDLFKKCNKRRKGISSDNLDSYLCEYIWRHRNQRNNLFNTILTDISELNMGS